MNKQKALFFALALSFGCGMLTVAPAGALDETVNSEIIVSGDEDPSTGDGEIYTEEVVTTSETGASQSAEENCDETTDEECQSDPERYDTELENALDEGLANEPEVICATADEEGCGEDIDLEMWPLYISLGALGATILLVIIINLIGRKKK